MYIKILGMGCEKCKKLYSMTNEIINSMGVDAQIEKVEDVQKIMSYKVMRTPALVVDDVVKVSGRIPDKNEIKKYIEEAVK